MKLESKRIFISDLPENIVQNEIQEKFTKFGNVTAVEIKERKDIGPKNTSHHFAFINLDVDNHSLQQCFEEFSNKKWKGQYVEIQLAKESFLDRLKKEREQAKTNGTSEHKDAEASNPINQTFKQFSRENRKVNGDSTKVKRDIKKVKKYKSSSDDSSSENETAVHTSKINKPVEPIEDIYSDMVVKNNKNKKFDNKIESVGFEPIIKYEIGKKQPKSKDPARTKANEARLSSIQDMKKAYQQQKSAVQRALSRIDCTPKNKTAFDKNDLELPLQKKAKHTHEGNDNRKSLFDDEVDDTDIGKINFNVKKQFQGEKGQKLFELQSRYKNDERFQMDSRFAENEEEIENDDYNKEEMTQEEEQRKQYEILEQVLGKKVTKMNTNEGSKHKGMLRFDPNQPDHSKYEMQHSTEKKRKKHSTEGKKDDEIVPEVSKETFYNVTDNLKEALQEKESFSLLSMFGTTHAPEQNDEPEEQSTDIVKKSKNKLEKDPNPFRYDSSTDDEDEQQGKIVKSSKKNIENLNAEESQKVGLGPSRLWTESFFFKEDDYRFQEGVDFIRKFEIEDKSEFLKLRRNIKEIVRAKVRNNQKKNKPFKKKLGGSGRKKMIRVKKALKR